MLVLLHTTNPIDTTLPIAVLINSYSASASEIVSGAIAILERKYIVLWRIFATYKKEQGDI